MIILTPLAFNVCYSLKSLCKGISLVNGTQLIMAIGVEALYRADMVAKQADVIAALSLEALQGTPRAFDYGEQTQCTIQRVFESEIYKA